MLPRLFQGCQNRTAGRSGPWTSPRAAREGGISRGPGFPSPGQQDIQVSVPSGEESSRRVGSWSRLRPGKAAGIAPTAPRRAWGAARTGLAVFAEPVRALTKHVRPEGLLLPCPGGPRRVAEQFGHGRREPLGATGTQGGMQPALLPVCGSMATFGGAWLKWGADMLLPATVVLSPCCPCSWGGGYGGTQLCGAHAAPQSGC